MQLGTNGVIIDVTRGGGCAESPDVLPVSARHAAEGLGRDHATRAETLAGARCGVEVTPAGSDDDGVVPVRGRRTRRSNSQISVSPVVLLCPPRGVASILPSWLVLVQGRVPVVFE